MVSRKGSAGDQTHPLFFQTKRRIEEVSTNVYLTGHSPQGQRVMRTVLYLRVSTAQH